MSTVLASALPEKPVFSADGRELGTVRDLTIDPRSGDFETLLVDPPATASGNGVESDGENERDPDGRIRIPGDAVTAVGDQVIVDLSSGKRR